MMKLNFETSYKKELDRLCFTPEEKAQIARRAALAAEKAPTEQRGRRGFKRGLVFAVAAVLMAVLSFGAVANAFLLSPRDAAKLLDHDQAALAFGKDTANTDEQEYQMGDYKVRLYGLATEEAELDQFDCTMKNGHTYVIVSYQRTDGAPIDFDKELGIQWKRIVFVSGLPIEVQFGMFSGGGYATVEDGIVYELFDCTNLGLFADHTAYLAIYKDDLTDLYEQKYGKRGDHEGLASAFPEYAIQMDEDGAASFLADYPKPHALFTLTLDESGADPERAQEYLETFPLYQDWVAQRGCFESGVQFDPQCVDDILEIYRPYEKRGYIPTK